VKREDQDYKAGFERGRAVGIVDASRKIKYHAAQYYKSEQASRAIELEGLAESVRKQATFDPGSIVLEREQLRIIRTYFLRASADAERRAQHIRDGIEYLGALCVDFD